MSRLLSRGAVLTFARVSNFAIMAISPLLLVRIFTVEGYGQYQEFMIYAMLLVAICSFGFDSSLTYFLPKYPQREGLFLAQTSLAVFGFSTLVLLTVVLARPLLLNVITYDFVFPLAAYVFFYVNLNWLEYYWIAKKRTDLVMFYSVGRLLLRVTAIVTAAYLTRDVFTVIWTGAAVEAVRFIFAMLYLARQQCLEFRLLRHELSEQFKFATPIGLASLASRASRDIAKLFISSTLGPTGLAFYAVGGYLLPFIHVVRSAIADVVFPELVEAERRGGSGLGLWRRSNVMYCALLFPAFVLLAYYTEFLIVTLFTEAYLPATPVFQVFLLFLLRRCFNADVVLRSRGKTSLVLVGTVLSLSLNVILMLLFYTWFGFIGPAAAFVLSEILLECYYAWNAKKILALEEESLIFWPDIIRIGVGCLAGIPILLIAELMPGPYVARAVPASLTYAVVCWLLAYKLGVLDIGRVARFAADQLRRLL